MSTNGTTATRLKDGDRGWDARRRDPRANGADIYVARFTKNGMGSAKPCWRCLEWCRWAGVKRIFHWNAEENRFEVVKVNNAESGQYETHADIRLFAGLARPLPRYKFLPRQLLPVPAYGRMELLMRGRASFLEKGMNSAMRPRTLLPIYQLFNQLCGQSHTCRQFTYLRRSYPAHCSASNIVGVQSYQGGEKQRKVCMLGRHPRSEECRIGFSEMSSTATKQRWPVWYG